MIRKHPAKKNRANYNLILGVFFAVGLIFGLGLGGIATLGQVLSTYPSYSSTTFLGLRDTPNSYAGQANKVVTVKPTQWGLTFTDLPADTDTRCDVPGLCNNVFGNQAEIGGFAPNGTPLASTIIDGDTIDTRSIVASGLINAQAFSSDQITTDSLYVLGPTGFTSISTPLAFFNDLRPNGVTCGIGQFIRKSANGTNWECVFPDSGSSASLDCTTVIQPFGNFSIDAGINCPAGYTVTGGGVSCDEAVTNTRPSGNGWFGACSSPGFGNSVHAVCCRIV